MLFMKTHGGPTLFPQVNPDQIICEAGALPNCIYQLHIPCKDKTLKLMSDGSGTAEYVEKESTMKLNI